MSWDYTLEPKGRRFSDDEIAEMACYLAARPTVYRRSDGGFVIASDRASRDTVIAHGTQDRVRYTASGVLLAHDVVTLGVVGYEDQNVELASFVAACQARWPCDLRDPDGQVLTPEGFLEQQRSLYAPE
jgi:hypothetical protein